MAGPIDNYVEPISQFARRLGVAFQILNDLGDWRGDNHNKLVAAGDVLGGRPTVLWALALEGLNDAGRDELRRLFSGKRADASVVSRVRQLYDDAGVFEKANRLVDKYRRRAQAVADEIEPEELRQLLYYLIDTVLADETHAEPDGIEPLLPMVTT
jgi:geranylgeranyl pyrophosphate synthase